MPATPDYSTWAHEISSGRSPSFRAGRLHGICLHLEACASSADSGSGPHVLLAREAAFVAALAALLCAPGALGESAVRVLDRLARPAANRLPLLRFPGLLDALVATPHEGRAADALAWLCRVKDGAAQAALAANAPLVGRLVAGVPRERAASEALRRLCGDDGNRARLYEHPGLLTTVVEATREAAVASAAVNVLSKMACADSLKMRMLRSPLVLEALLGAANHSVDRVSNSAVDCLNNLSNKAENRALMRDDARIMDALRARIDYKDSKKALFRLCYTDTLPTFFPSLDLSLFCSSPCRHQLSLVKALIREHPEQLSAKDASGRTPLTLAQAAHLPAPITGLLSDCLSAAALGFSLTHLVGYTRPGFALARAQRLALMCSLERAADGAAPPAREDEQGELNPGKALKGYLVGARTARLKGYLNGGKDPWAVIGRFAF
ncbi:hypothetical protein TeGR_g3800 [Tetraparma gracilis]|uniref:Uncharacterized protein n=1 Tax=Tetraparma gracilis TaxID=2962635 RepID=A0ABQ6N7P1_9STRA|nr:hypothetical protein TeGR_g3800 [Tetraparma gracilis]